MTRTALDPSSGVPLYRQIAEILRVEIVAGEVDASTPMTEEKLLARFGVSRAPIRQALGELVAAGLVTRKQGKGTFAVPGARVDRPADLPAGDLYRYLAERGLHPTSEVSELTRVNPAEATRERLGAESGERVLSFRRVLAVEGRPFAVNDIAVRSPEAFLPTAQELADGGSALDLLARSHGITVERAEHEAWASGATGELARELGVAEGDPLLMIDTVFYGRGGAPVALRHAAHVADSFTFRFVTGV